MSPQTDVRSPREALLGRLEDRLAKLMGDLEGLNQQIESALAANSHPDQTKTRTRA